MRLPAIVTVLVCLAGAAASAQVHPRPPVDFKKGLDLPPAVVPQKSPLPEHRTLLEDRVRLRLKETRERHETEEAIDCAMVKPVDPKFHSHMPVHRPPRGVRFAMNVVLAPPCRGKSLLGA